MAAKRSNPKQFHISAWQNWNEWLDVYDLLFDKNEPNDIEVALEIINMWKLRNASKLPVAIDCTSALFMVFLSKHQPIPVDSNEDESKSLVDEHNWRRTCSMAIVRFINGMVDQDQKGVYARTVQSVADGLGIPDWLVDLRHEATHSNLPSTEILQQAFITCQRWIKETYWNPTRLMILETENTFACQFKNLLEDFISAMMRSPKNGTNDLSKNCKTKLGYIIDLIKASIDFLSIHSLAVKLIAASIYDVGHESQNGALLLSGIWSRLVQYLSHFIPNIYRKLILELCENVESLSVHSVRKGIEIIWCLLEQNQHASNESISNFILALGLKYVVCVPLNILEFALNLSNINVDLKSQLLSLYTVANGFNMKIKLSLMRSMDRDIDIDIRPALKYFESSQNVDVELFISQIMEGKHFSCDNVFSICEHGAAWEQIPIGTIIGCQGNDYKALWVKDEKSMKDRIWKDIENAVEAIKVKSFGGDIILDKMDIDLNQEDFVSSSKYRISLF